MKKSLLIASLFLTATAGWAQDSMETALDATAGQDNTTELTAEGTAYWKYTASQDELIYVGPKEGNSYVYAYVYGTKDGQNVTTSNSMKSAQNGNKYIYPVPAGTTVYIAVEGSAGTVGFNLTAAAMDLSNDGLDENTPKEIKTGETQYMGNAYATSSYTNYNMYTTYTATEDGQLVISSKDYFGNYTVNGGSSTYAESKYVDGAYVYTAKASVTAGQTYTIVFSAYNPIVFSSEMTHPTAGSLEMPFELSTESENIVPADFGTYYYTYKPDKKGYLTFKSDDEFTGTLEIYPSKSYLNYGSTYANAVFTNTLNGRSEVTSTYSTMWIKVEKTESTEAEQKFTFSADDYAQGETSSNPIALDLPVESQTLPNASGTYYYSVEVPANTVKFLVVKALSDVTNTTISVYPQSSSWNSTTSETGLVKVDVTGTADATWIIKVKSAESQPVSFSVDFADINKGDAITNPLEAVLGENVFVGEGTQYYTYTATKNGKLSVTLDNAQATVAFPEGTGKYDGTYETTQSGSTYYITATAGTSYYITITGAVVGEKFTLAEDEFAEGESMSNPVKVGEDGVYAINKDKLPVWVAYTATKSGRLTIEIPDVEVDYQNDNVNYMKATDAYSNSLLKYMGTDDSGNYIFQLQQKVNVKEGDVVYVNIVSLSNITDDTKLVFTLNEVGTGESKDQAILLELNEETEIGVPTAAEPVWCKIVGNGEQIQLKASDTAMGYWYTGEDAQDDESEDASFSITSEEGDPEFGWYYLYTREVSEANVHYLKFIRAGYSTLTVTLLSGQDENVTNGINSVETAEGGMQVYNLSGQKIAETTSGLKAGVYVVSKNGKTQKVLVK